MDEKESQRMRGLFLNMVLQHTNMALVMLGHVAHPETGEKVREPDSARMLIDQLEMLEAKTRGNLSKEEGDFLKQSLYQLRMAYVKEAEGSTPSMEKTSTSQAGGKPGGESKPTEAPSSSTAPSSTAPSSTAPSSTVSSSLKEGGVEEPPQPEESKKRFTKKYE